MGRLPFTRGSFFLGLSFILPFQYLVNARIINSPIALPVDQCRDLTTFPLSIVHTLTTDLVLQENEVFASSSVHHRPSSGILYICNPQDIHRITPEHRIVILLNTGLWSTDNLNSYLQLYTLTNSSSSSFVEVPGPTDIYGLSSSTKVIGYTKLPLLSLFLQQVLIYHHYQLCAVPSILDQPFILIREDYYYDSIEDTLLRLSSSDESSSSSFSFFNLSSIYSKPFALCITRSIAVTAAQNKYMRSLDPDAFLLATTTTTDGRSDTGENKLPLTWGIRILQTKGPRYLLILIEKYLYSITCIKKLLNNRTISNSFDNRLPDTSTVLQDSTCPFSPPHTPPWKSRLLCYMNTPSVASSSSVLPYLELLSADLHSLKLSFPDKNSSNCINRTYLFEFITTVRSICRSTLFRDELHKKAAQTEWSKNKDRYTDLLTSLGFLLHVSLITQTDIFSDCLQDEFSVPVTDPTILDNYGYGVGCIPSSSTATFPSSLPFSICNPEVLWSTNKAILIPYAFRVVGSSAMGFLSDPFLYYEIGSFLHYGLTYNSSNNKSLPPIDWHPTGWPNIDASMDELVIVPQTTYYFAISYYYVSLEKAFKKAMHDRIGYTASRAESLVYQASIHPSILHLPSFNRTIRSVVTNTSCSYPILILSSFWDKGHSSHRVTAPLIEALARQPNVCLYLLYLYIENMARDSLSIFQETIPYTLPAEDYSGALALHSYVQQQLQYICFYGIIYPSVGMVPIDIALLSFPRVQCGTDRTTNSTVIESIMVPSLSSDSVPSIPFRPLQMVLYGHSVSTYSSNTDIFIGGFEPEILGPVSSDIYHNLDDTKDSCTVMSATLQTITAALLTSKAGSPTDNYSRYPLMIFCEETNVSSVQCLPRPTYIATNTTNVTASVSLTLTELFRRTSEYCRTTFPTDLQLFSSVLDQRLRDAQTRYTERLFLLPGLGLWFTDTFPNFVKQDDSPPAESKIISSYPSFLSLAKVWKHLSELPVKRMNIPSLSESAVNDILHHLSVPLLHGTSKDNPFRIGLVWSLVKWNAIQVQKLRILLHGIQSKFSYLWKKCSTLVSNSSSSTSAGNPTVPTKLCTFLHQNYPEPFLYLKLHAFTNMNIQQDGLQTLAIMRTLHTLLVSEFEVNASFYPSSYVEVQFDYNASEAENYLNRLSSMNLLIDSLPFSACNTMQDAFALSIPIIGLHHDNLYEPGTSSPVRWRSSIGACMLTKAGLTGLVALDEQEWYEKNIQLVTNPFLHYLWTQRMKNNDEWKRIMDKERSERDALWVTNLLRYSRTTDYSMFNQ